MKLGVDPHVAVFETHVRSSRHHAGDRELFIDEPRESAVESEVKIELAFERGCEIELPLDARERVLLEKRSGSDLQTTRPHEEIRVDRAEGLVESVSRARVEHDAVSFLGVENVDCDVLGREPFREPARLVVILKAYRELSHGEGADPG